MIRVGIVRLTGLELAYQRRSILSRGESAPFSERGGAILLEGIAAVEMAVPVEVVVDRGMGGGESLQGLHISEFRHRSFSPSERLVGNLGSIVEPPTALLFGRIADYLHRRSVRRKPVGYPIRLLHTKPSDSQIFRAQLAAIGAAKRYIYIHTPYFSDDEFLVELIGARRRGVDVRVIISTRGDSPMMDRSNVLAANAMFQNGIRVYLYPGFSHVKAAIYDGWACLGSANLDKLSLRVNKELNLATSHRATVQALEQQLFDPDFEKSTEMTRPIEEHWSFYPAEFLADQL